MSEEQRTRIEVPFANAHVTRTIIAEERYAASGWAIALLVLVALVAGIWFLSHTSGSEMTKGGTMAEVTDEIDDVASTVGDATPGMGQIAGKTVNE